MDADQQVRLVGLERREQEYIKKLWVIERRMEKMQCAIDEEMMSVLQHEIETSKALAKIAEKIHELTGQRLMRW